jgi:hypothetical protein
VQLRRVTSVISCPCQKELDPARRAASTSGWIQKGPCAAKLCVLRCTGCGVPQWPVAAWCVTPTRVPDTVPSKYASSASVEVTPPPSTPPRYHARTPDCIQPVSACTIPAPSPSTTTNQAAFFMGFLLAAILATHG